MRNIHERFHKLRIGAVGVTRVKLTNLGSVYLKVT